MTPLTRSTGYVFHQLSTATQSPASDAMFQSAWTLRSWLVKRRPSGCVRVPSFSG